MKSKIVAAAMAGSVLLSTHCPAAELFKGAQKLGPSAEQPGLQQYRLSNGRVVAFGPEVIVKLKKGTDITPLVKAFNPVRFEALSDTLVLMTFPADADALELSSRIAQQNGVILAQPNLHTQKQQR